MATAGTGDVLTGTIAFDAVGGAAGSGRAGAPAVGPPSSVRSGLVASDVAGARPTPGPTCSADIPSPFVPQRRGDTVHGDKPGPGVVGRVAGSIDLYRTSSRRCPHVDLDAVAHWRGRSSGPVASAELCVVVQGRLARLRTS